MDTWGMTDEERIATNAGAQKIIEGVERAQHLEALGLHLLEEYRLWDIWSSSFMAITYNTREDAEKASHHYSEGKGEDGGIRIMTRKVTAWEHLKDNDK